MSTRSTFAYEGATMRRLYLTVLSASLLAPFPRALPAQLLASEPAEVTQTVDGTRVTVQYSRPRARGRTGLFGTRIHDGELWTAGANAATTLALNKDVTINGQAVPKGKYSVWLAIARGDWEMILDRDTTLYHTQGPRRRPGQVRFAAPRERRPFMEALTWWFPDVSATGMTLAMQWDTVYVPLRITVAPSYSTKVTPEVARPLVGRYLMHNEAMASPDTTLAPDPDQPAANLTFTIRYENGELRGVMDPPFVKTETGYTDWVLIPTKGRYFYLGRFDAGQLVEIIDFASLRFNIAGDRATGYEYRMQNDQLIGSGKRIP
jgi:hypothetical protein